MKGFLVVIEKVGGNYSTYSPGLPGCVATGETQEETERNMRAAILFHIEGLIEDNLPIPNSTSSAQNVAVP